MINRTIERIQNGGYRINALIRKKNDFRKLGVFYHGEQFYGYTKRECIRLYNNSLKKYDYVYVKE